jgi:hypothetical protein
MAKTKISEYSSTASNNTDVDGINIAEGMAPSNVNNAMREIMAQLKDWQSGAVSQDMYVNGAFTASGNAVLSADLSVGDDLTVTGDASVGGGFTCTGAAILSSSLSVAGTSSLGAVTFSGAVIMSSTLAANGNVTVGTSTTNSHTLNGNLTVGSSTSNTVTLNTLLSAGGSAGSSGQVLKSRGTSNTPEWSGAPVSDTAWTYTSGTPSSIDFTSIPSWVKRITVSITGLSFAAAGTFRLRVGTSSGLVATGYSGSRTVISDADTVSVDATTDGLAGVSTDAAVTTIIGIYTITNITGNTWVCSGNVQRIGDDRIVFTNGSIALAATLDRLSLVATTSTFDAGTVNIMYE